MIAAVLIVVLPPISVVKLLNPLTIPLKVVMPPLLSVNANPPPLTLAKLIAPALSVVPTPSVTASL